MSCARKCSAPTQGHADVPGHSVREINDLNLELIAAFAKVSVPKVVDLLWHSGQGVFPTRLPLVDGTSLVGAERIREPIDLDLGQAVGGCALDDPHGAANSLLVGNPRWLGQ